MASFFVHADRRTGRFSIHDLADFENQKRNRRGELQLSWTLADRRAGDESRIKCSYYGCIAVLIDAGAEAFGRGTSVLSGAYALADDADRTRPIA